jgi:hypothetical protein
MLVPAVDRQVSKNDNSDCPALEAARDTLTAFSKFLQDYPVIENAQDDIKVTNWIERARLNLASIDDELKPKADPLYAQWKAVREPYTRVIEPLKKLFDEAKRRANKFKLAVENARKAEAERLRREAEAKERAAREAEAREVEAVAAVDVGVCEDVGTAIVEANEAFHDFQVADREAARAERSVPVRVASIAGGRPITMRNKRVLVVEDPIAAVKAMWPNERIADAIRLAAKDYQNAFDELPPGIIETVERSL